MSRKIAFVLTIAFLLSNGHSLHAGSFDLLAVSGEATPDGMYEYDYFSWIGINQLGQVSFNASYSDNNDSSAGVFVTDNGAITQVAAAGDLAPDGNGNYRFFARTNVDAAGRVYFESGLENTTGGASDDYGSFFTDGQTSTQLFREGYFTPGGVYKYGRPRAPLITQSGYAAIGTTLNGYGLYGVYRAHGQNATEIAHSNQQIVGTSETFGTLPRPDINEPGQVAFLSHSFDTNGMFEGPFRSLFLDSGAGPVEIIRAGMSDPGSQGILEGLSNLVLSDSGQVGFTAKLSVGSTQGQGFDEGIFLWDDGTISPRVRPGEPVANSTNTISNILSYLLQMNEQSDILFYGSTDNDFSRDLFLSTTSGIERVVGKGDAAPGKAGESPEFASISDVKLSENGEIYFTAVLRETLGGDADNRGLYVYEDGQISELLREGDELAGETVASINSVSSAGHPEFAYDDAGYLALNVRFSNDTWAIARFTVGETITADFDNDDFVDSTDLEIWQNAYGQTSLGDSSGDSDTDGEDFLAFQRNYTDNALAADFDENNEVNALDLSIWKTAYGVSSQGDSGSDDDTDGQDFLRWQRNASSFNSLAGAQAIPEPAGVSMIAACLLASLTSHRRSRSTRT